MTTVGLAVALGGLALLIWFTAFAWSNHTARHVIRGEMEGVMADVVSETGTLDASQYAWNEPHHLFKGRHVDPFYLQIFDARGQLVRQSDNIDKFPAEAYPERPLVATTWHDELYDPLRTFRVEEALLYYSTRPILNASGEQVGTIQLAREEPQVGAFQRRMALFLGGGVLLTLLALGGLVWWIAGRVLRPLETITTSTRNLAPDQLNHRIPVPEEADRETAQLARTLNTLLDRLETAFDEMRRFTASAAHELKTPLTALQGHVDVSLRRSRDAASYRDTLGLVRTKIDHLIATVQGLLTLARLDQSGQTAPTEPVDLAAVARQVARAHRSQAEEKELAFDVSASEAVHVAGQEGMLRELVANLIDNAIKYTPQGRVAVTVTADGTAGVLQVRDTGVGIDPEVLPHVTDRFYRASTRETAKVPGSGLGLALVQQIVHWHGGMLDIDAAPDEGTRVTVRLPTAAMDESAKATAGVAGDVSA